VSASFIGHLVGIGGKLVCGKVEGKIKFKVEERES
jgi:hypothetical protein